MSMFRPSERRCSGSSWACTCSRGMYLQRSFVRLDRAYRCCHDRPRYRPAESCCRRSSRRPVCSLWARSGSCGTHVPRGRAWPFRQLHARRRSSACRYLRSDSRSLRMCRPSILAQVRRTVRRNSRCRSSTRRTTAETSHRANRDRCSPGSTYNCVVAQSRDFSDRAVHRHSHDPSRSPRSSRGRHCKPAQDRTANLCRGSGRHIVRRGTPCRRCTGSWSGTPRNADGGYHRRRLRNRDRTYSEWKHRGPRRHQRRPETPTRRPKRRWLEREHRR